MERRRLTPDGAAEGRGSELGGGAVDGDAAEQEVADGGGDEGGLRGIEDVRQGVVDHTEWPGLALLHDVDEVLLGKRGILELVHCWVL